MIHQLNIVHSTDSVKAELPKGHILWKTCLRSIIFINGPQGATHTGDCAYEFLLQVICGLHSPMLGETEILSQFKDFIRKNPAAIVPKIANKLIQDAKLLRTKYLKGYGCQSYGSYTLKESKGLKKIVFLGGGNLVQEILPIVKDFSGELILRLRDPKKGQAITAKFAQVKIQKLEHAHAPQSGALIVIAAPLESQELELLLAQQFQNSSVLDMRSKTDGPSLELPLELKYKTLEQIFSEITKTQDVLRFTSEKIKVEIKKLSQEWFTKAQMRPFGWEDLCC